MVDVMKVILIADAGLLLWGAGAALVPERVPGPGSVPILTAGYESFTRGSWSELAVTSPMTAEFMTLLFRLYGAYIVAFGVLAIASLSPPSAVVTVGRGGRYWSATRSRSARPWRTTGSRAPSDRSSCRNTSASPPSTAHSRSQLHSSQRDASSIDGLTRSGPGNDGRTPEPIGRILAWSPAGHVTVGIRRRVVVLTR